MIVAEKVMETMCVDFNVVIKDKVGMSKGGKVPFNVIIEVIMDDTWMGIQNKEGKWILSKKAKGYRMKKEGTKATSLDGKVPDEKKIKRIEPLFGMYHLETLLVMITGGKAPPRVVPHNENIKKCNMSQYVHIFFLHCFKVQRKKTIFPHESLFYSCIEIMLKFGGEKERESGRNRKKIECKNKKNALGRGEKRSNEEQQRETQEVEENIKKGKEEEKKSSR
jgi:hypothetical protein